MTTIFSDGRYLAADKRTTHYTSVERFDKGLKHRSDVTSKIFHVDSFMISGVKISVAAMAGGGTTISQITKILKVKHKIPQELQAHLATIRQLDHQGSGCTAILLLEDGTNYTLEIFKVPSILIGGKTTNGIRLEKIKKDSIVAKGAGSRWYDLLKDQVKEKIEPWEWFLFCCYMDHSSSYEFDLFDLNDGHNDKIVKIEPDRSLMQNAANKILKNLDFVGLHKKPTPVETVDKETA